MMLTGGVIAYKTQFQYNTSSVATSTTPVVNRSRIHISSRNKKYGPLLVFQINSLQITIMSEDNMGTMFMSIANQLTNHTRHMDTKLFSLQQED